MFHFYECSNTTCRLRFPADVAPLHGISCPKCGGATAVTGDAVGQREFTSASVGDPPPLDVLLDNIRSVYNVGSIFRTADGAGVRHIHLGGITAPPTHPRIAKTALGAQSGLAWSHSNNGYETAVNLKQAGYRLWALETAPGAASIFAAGLSPITTPTLLIVGNEKAGIDPDILSLCDRVLALPMQGIKESLNVAVAFGIALYHLRYAAISDQPAK